jgi:hypothetical protein
MKSDVIEGSLAEVEKSRAKDMLHYPGPGKSILTTTSYIKQSYEQTTRSCCNRPSYDVMRRLLHVAPVDEMRVCNNNTKLKRRIWIGPDVHLFALKTELTM